MEKDDHIHSCSMLCAIYNKSMFSKFNIIEIFFGETASPREGWGVVLPVTGGGDEGGGDRLDSYLNPPEAEHGRAIYCDAADSGPV